jgi:hypothetical protein
MTQQPITMRFWLENKSDEKLFSQDIRLSDVGREYLRDRCKGFRCKKCGAEIELNSEDEIVCKNSDHHPEYYWRIPWILENSPLFCVGEGYGRGHGNAK